MGAGARAEGKEEVRIVIEIDDNDRDVFSPGAVMTVESVLHPVRGQGYGYWDFTVVGAGDEGEE